MVEDHDDVKALAREVRCLRWAVIALTVVVVLGLADRLVRLLEFWFVLIVPAAFWGMHFFLEWVSPTKPRRDTRRT